VSDLVQPVTFFIPSTAGEPIDIDVVHSGLRMVLVNREAIGQLDSEWKELGIYSCSARQRIPSASLCTSEKWAGGTC